jgi:hypothetical protein
MHNRTDSLQPLVVPARRMTAIPSHTFRGMLLAGLVACAFNAGAATVSVTVTDQSKALLDDAVIYAVQVPGINTLPKRGGIVDQVNREFLPYVTAVQTGTAVSFPNKDNIRHHVYSFSPAKTFELRLYSGTPSKPVVFDKPGAVVLGCNIHDWMLAYIYVVDTPHFSKTAKGGARLDGLPAAEYELRVWHPQLRGPVPMQRIKISAEDAATYQFALDLGPKPTAGSVGPAKKDGP